MVTVIIICPNLKCRKVLKVPEQYRGRHVKCHHCGTTFCVPVSKTEAKPIASKEKAE